MRKVRCHNGVWKSTWRAGAINDRVAALTDHFMLEQYEKNAARSDIYTRTGIPTGAAALGCPPGKARLPGVVHLALSSRAKLSFAKRTATKSKDPYPPIAWPCRFREF